MIRSERVGDIAVLTIDNPPVNATSQAVRQGLLDALSAASSDTRVAAIVLIGANGRFSAGGDVRELGNTALNQPSLRDTIALIEASAMPVIAALDGIALGGGLELALACHYRIGRAGVKVGLPEVTLGVIPGAGGTQRLPRLIGPSAALEIITSGRHVQADEALRLGILDELAIGDLLEAAIELARRALLAGVRPQAVSARTDRIRNIDPGLFEAFRDQHRQAWRDALAPWKIVQAIEYACTQPLDVGLRYEREAYVECQQSPQRAVLAQQFMARRAARKT
jgi:3-hydroxyacyl-CoA dehydrogenase